MRPSLSELFIAFATISLYGFGGVLAWSRRMMVEERHWLTAEQFNEAYALCAFLPGRNILNFSVMFGSRFRGPPGGAVALAGLIGPPMLLVMIIGAIYAHYGDLPVLRRMLTGVASAAAGLMMATVAKMAQPLFRNRAVIGPLIALVDLRRDRHHALAIGAGAGDHRAGEHRTGMGAAMKADGGTLLLLAGYFALMSLFAIGGANSAVPEMHRFAVDVQHWLTDQQFSDTFALAQLTPGPNVIIVTLIGYHVAGARRRAGDDAGDVRTDLRVRLLCRPRLRALQGFGMARRAEPRPDPGHARADGSERHRDRDHERFWLARGRDYARHRVDRLFRARASAVGLCRRRAARSRRPDRAAFRRLQRSCARFVRRSFDGKL